MQAISQKHPDQGCTWSWTLHNSFRDHWPQ